MKKLNLVILMAMVLIVSGCAAHRTSPERGDVAVDSSSGYSVVVSPATSVTISKLAAYQNGTDQIVSGIVKRLHKVNLPGHMHLFVCSPDGALLSQETTRVLGLASNRNGVMRLPFSFRLQTAPPEGASIRVEYHAPASKKKGHLNCA